MNLKPRNAWVLLAGLCFLPPPNVHCTCGGTRHLPLGGFNPAGRMPSAEERAQTVQYRKSETGAIPTGPPTRQRISKPRPVRQGGIFLFLRQFRRHADLRTPACLRARFKIFAAKLLLLRRLRRAADHWSIPQRVRGRECRCALPRISSPPLPRQKQKHRKTRTASFFSIQFLPVSYAQ